MQMMLEITAERANYLLAEALSKEIVELAQEELFRRTGDYRCSEYGAISIPNFPQLVTQDTIIPVDTTIIRWQDRS